MAVIPVVSPRICGVPGIDSPLVRSYNLQQGAAYRGADFLILKVTGTDSAATRLAVSSGTLANVAGPVFAAPISINSTAAVTNGNITITGVVSASAPAAIYYVYTTYTYAGPNESLPGPEFIVNCAAGYMFSVNVLAAAAPATATNFAVYVSTYESGELLQQASKVTTALGTAFSVVYPLTNSTGMTRAIAGSSASIVGISLHDSQSLWATGVGGGFTAGGISNLLGAWMPPPTLGPIDPSQGLVTSLINGQPFEISLVQPWTAALLGQPAGLNIDATTGFFVADTTQTTFFTIIEKVFGSPTDVGGSTDTGSRVKCVATSGVI